MEDYIDGRCKILLMEDERCKIILMVDGRFYVVDEKKKI